MAMTEKDLAEWLMADRGQVYVDKFNGDTIGAYQLADLHQEHCFEMGKSVLATDVECQAIRHWVLSAGYGKDGKFIYVISNIIQNC